MAKQLKIKDKNGNILYPMVFETGFAEDYTSRYVKFANGILIVFGSKVKCKLVNDTWGTWGEIYSNTLSGEIPFSCPFAFNPAIFVSCTDEGWATAIGQVLVSKTAITKITFLRGNSTNHTPFLIDFLAIGCWK